MTKKEATTPPSLEVMFQIILSNEDQLAQFMDSPDWRQCQFSNHVKWLKPLLKHGFIEHVGKSPAWPDGNVPRGQSQFNYHCYRPTSAGINWWLERRVAMREKDSPMSPAVLIEEYRNLPPLSGKGIGALVTYTRWHYVIEAAMEAVLRGFFEFVDYYWYPRGGEERLTVRLTERGMQYFDSLPRLALECA